MNPKVTIKITIDIEVADGVANVEVHTDPPPPSRPSGIVEATPKRIPEEAPLGLDFGELAPLPSPPIEEGLEAPVVLPDVDDVTLVRWAEACGAAHPEDFLEMNEVPDGSGPFASSRNEAVEILRDLVRAEKRAGNPMADAPPAPGLWHTYLGAGFTPGVVADRQEPRMFGDLRAILESRAAVRVTGAGHSSTDVAMPLAQALSLRLHAMHDLRLGEAGLQVAPRHVRQRHAAPWRTVRVPAGMRVRDANPALWSAGYCLDQAGAFDAQSLWGALTTGTHGSGAAQGLVADYVESADVLVYRADGSVAPVRVEPTDGPTDAGAFRNDPEARALGYELVQDDATFHALCVSMGSMGVVFAILLRVRTRFHLRETREGRRFEREDLREYLRRVEAVAAGPAFDPDRVQHEMLVNPYRLGRFTRVLVTRRTVEPGVPTESWEETRRRGVQQTLLGFKRLGPSRTAKRIGFFPAPDALSVGLRCSAVEPWVSAATRVMYLGAGRFVSASSCEVAVPIDRALDAILAIQEVAEGLLAEGISFTAPIGVRFVRPGAHWLAPTFRVDSRGRRPACYALIEVPVALGSRGEERILTECERALVRADGRPHWGHLSLATFGSARHPRPEAHANLVRMWGQASVDAWKAARRRLDPLGRFDNGFTRRLGL